MVNVFERNNGVPADGDVRKYKKKSVAQPATMISNLLNLDAIKDVPIE